MFVLLPGPAAVPPEMWLVQLLEFVLEASSAELKLVTLQATDIYWMVSDPVVAAVLNSMVDSSTGPGLGKRTGVLRMGPGLETLSMQQLFEPDLGQQLSGADLGSVAVHCVTCPWVREWLLVDREKGGLAGLSEFVESVLKLF